MSSFGIESAAMVEAIEMNTRVMPIVTFSNTAEDILTYLAKRTADTIGQQVNRSQVIVVGHVQEYDAYYLPVRSEDVAGLQPWLHREAGETPQIFVQVTTLQVERWLVGATRTSQLDLFYVHPTRVAPHLGEMPIFYAQDRGLVFLQEVSPDVPYASYVPHPAYQLAAGEKGVRNFLVTDFDEKGREFVRDETAKIEETITAVQWYASLAHEKQEIIHKALLQALDSINPRVSRHAIRALAHQGDSTTAQAFNERLPNASQDLQCRLMLGLWILGEKEAAENILEELFRVHGKYAWLAGWDIERTLVEEGQAVETLYGPDPSELKGD